MKRCIDCKGEGWGLINCLPRGRKNSIVQCNHCKGTGKEPPASVGNSGEKNKGEAMTREIKFRGRATCSDRWAYGCYVECDGGYYIIEKRRGDREGGVAKIQVHPATVGQSTGKLDKKNREVYDDDFCLIYVDFSQADAEKPYCKNLKVHIFYDDELFAWCWHAPDKHGGQTAQFNEYEFDVLEVCGDIHTTPALLAEGKE